MSFPPGQYPQQPYPQQPNPYGYNPAGYYGYAQDPSSLLGPARWTCGLMIALGSVLLLMAGCVGVMAVGVSMPEVWTAMEKEMQNNPQFAELNASDLQGFFKVVFAVFASAMLVASILAISFGIWAKGGSRGGLITSMIFAILTVLSCLLLLIGAPLQGLCMFGLPMLLSIGAIVASIKALGNVKQINLLTAHQQMLWQQHQQQQAYAYQQQQGQGLQ